MSDGLVPAAAGFSSSARLADGTLPARRPLCCPPWFWSGAACGRDGALPGITSPTIGFWCSAPHPDFLPKHSTLPLGRRARPSSAVKPLSVCSFAVYWWEMSPDAGAHNGGLPKGVATGRAPDGERARSRLADRMQRRPATATENLCGFRHQAVLPWRQGLAQPRWGAAAMAAAPHRGCASRRAGAPRFVDTATDVLEGQPPRGTRARLGAASTAARDDPWRGGDARPAGGWGSIRQGSPRGRLTASEATRRASTPTLTAVRPRHPFPSDAPPHLSRFFFCQTPRKQTRSRWAARISWDGCTARRSAGTRGHTGGLFTPSQRRPPDARGGSYAPADGRNVRPHTTAECAPAHAPRLSLLPLRAGPPAHPHARCACVCRPTSSPYRFSPFGRIFRCRAPGSHHAPCHRVHPATVGHRARHRRPRAPHGRGVIDWWALAQRPPNPPARGVRCGGRGSGGWGRGWGGIRRVVGGLVLAAVMRVRPPPEARRRKSDMPAGDTSA